MPRALRSPRRGHPGMGLRVILAQGLERGLPTVAITGFSGRESGGGGGGLAGKDTREALQMGLHEGISMTVWSSSRVPGAKPLRGTPEWPMRCGFKNPSRNRSSRI